MEYPPLQQLVLMHQQSPKDKNRRGPMWSANLITSSWQGNFRRWMVEFSFADWLAVALAAILWAFFYCADPVEQDYSIRLRENDYTLMYGNGSSPRERENTAVIACVSVLLPIGAIVVRELACKCDRRIVNLNQSILKFLGALCFSGLVVEFFRANVGALRPDFWQRCQPDDDGICTGDQGIIRDGRRSFPSGIACVSFAGLGYFSFYLHAGLADMETLAFAGNLWKVFFVLTVLFLVSWVSLTQFKRNLHHIEDIVIGGLVGATIAYGMFHWRPAGGDHAPEADATTCH